MNGEKYKKISIEVQKEQINRILDLEPNVQIQNSGFILNDLTSDDITQEMTREDFMELTNMERRRRNLSNSSSCDSNDLPKMLYGQNKDIIYYDLQEDDTLPKLALQFACKVSEIKHANKIYNDKELHALRTIKLPVVKNGAIYEKYMNGDKNEADSASNLLIDLNDAGDHDNTKDIVGKTFDSERKNIFKVQTSHKINPGFEYLESDGDNEDELDIFNRQNSEAQSLLVNSNSSHGSEPMSSEKEVSVDDYISKVDDRIQQEIQNVRLQQGVEDTDLIADIGAVPTDQRVKPEDYGSVGFCSWKFWLAILCIVAIVLPVLYFIHYYKVKQ